MIRRLLAMGAIAVLVVGLGCSSGSGPILPDKGSSTTPEESLGSIDLTGVAIAEFTFSDLQGTVVTSGLLGRYEDGRLYVMEERGTQSDVDLAPLKLVNVFVTYKNPVGTAGNGLPYYYRGNTMLYEVTIMSLDSSDIGTPQNPARMTAEMHRAYVNTWTGQVIVGPLMLGDATFVWEGVVPSGYTDIMDTYYIDPANPSGNFVTTVRLELPLPYGTLDVLFYDAIAGVFDPK